MIDYLWIVMIVLADIFWLIFSISNFAEGIKERWIRKDTIWEMLEEIPLFWWLLSHGIIVFLISLISFMMHLER